MQIMFSDLLVTNLVKFASSEEVKSHIFALQAAIKTIGDEDQYFSRVSLR